MAIKNTIIDVQSVQVLDRLYVFETTPYEIEYDESVTRIYVVDECYDAFLEVNPTAPLKTFNPEAIQAALPEWYEYVCVAIDEDSNSALLSLLYDAGLIENEDYATYAEIRAINSSQFADAFSSASSLTSFDEFELFTGVKKLGDYAFSGCPNMESIKFPDSVYKLGKNVLAGCNSLENVEVDGNNAHFYSPEGSNLIVDKTTRTIVAGCGSSTIPSDVYYIGDYAFAGSNLTEITIPSNIREIGDHAFDGCSALEYIEMESENPPKIGDNVFDDVSEDFEIDVPEDAVETYTEDDDWSQYAEYINGGQPQPHPKDLSDDEFGLESDDITITNEQMPVIIPLVNTHDLPVTYASSDTSIATVDQTGVVTLSYENGNTNITVSFAGNDEYKAKTLTYAVTVAIPQELSDAEFSWSASSATATEAGSFSGVTLINTHGLSVSYSSSDTSVASIEPTYGHVIVSADGTTVISAAFAGNAQYKAKTVTYTLTVSLAQDLTDQEFGLSSSSTTISTEGATVTLPVINIYNLPVTYTTSNNVVATVDANGNVTLSYVDGVALISIAFAGNSTYKAKTLVYTINVDMPAQIEHVMHTTFTVSQAQVGTDTKLMRDEAHLSYFNSMIIDNVEMPVTYTYNFSTAGEHSVDYKIVKSNPDLPRTLFNGINQLNTCYMPDGITAVRYQTFFNNTGVSYISVPNGVTSLEAQSFRGTTHLQTVYLPDTVAHINTASFRGSGIESIRIPAGVTQLISNSFESCTNLTYIEIPATVTSIESQVFYKCSNLATVVSYNTTPPALNAQAFADTALNAIYVPFANVPDYQAANNWSTYASIIQPIGGKHTLTDAEFGLSSSSATITNSGSMSNYLVNTNNLPVTYSSSDSTVLTVDANGDLTVVADGSATITVSFAGNGQYLPKTLTFSATCEKAVRRALTDQEFSYDISDVENQGYLRVDMDENISDIIDDYIINEYDLPITWTIADTSVIDTDEGMIYYTNPGTTTINFVFAGNSTYLPKTVSLPVYYRGDTDLTVLYEFKDNPNNYVYTSLFNSDYLSIANNKISTIYIDGIPLNEIPNDGHCTFDTTTSEEYGTSIPLGYHTIEYKFNEVDDGYIEIPNVNNNTPLLKFGNYYGTHGGVSQWHYPAVVDIENGVERVANSALNSGWIKEITFPSSIEYIGSAVGGGTIYGDHYLKIITCYATTPPELNGNPFGSSVLKIYVPDESLSDYDNNWSYYGPYHEDILYGIDSKSRNNRGSITIKVGSTSVQTRSANSTYTATLFNESLFLDSNDNFSQYKYDEVVMETNIDSYYVPYLTGSSYTFDTDGLHTANFLLGRNNVVPAYFFEGCDDIESVTLDKCIDTIESYAFANCNSIDSVYIQKSIAYINSYAFYDTNISYLEILATTPPTLGDNVFSTEPDYISVPTAYENDYKQASGWSDYEDIINPQPKYDIDCTFNITTTSSNTWLYSSKVSSIDELYIDGVKQDTVVNEYQFDTTGTHKVQINLKSNITAVPTEMFASNTNLTECILSDRITSLGEYGTFRGASNLTYVNIPSQVTSIGSQMFQATKLSNVILPEGLTSLGFYAFNNCTLLSLVELPSTITSLGDGVFNNTIITSIEIPAGVTTMSSALYNCTHLETLISYAATPPTVTWHGLNNHAANRKIYVPAASVDLYKAAQYWSTYASDIEAIPQEGYTINYTVNAEDTAMNDTPIISSMAFEIEDPQSGEVEFSIDYFNEIVDSITVNGVELLVETADDLAYDFSSTGDGLYEVELVLNVDYIPTFMFRSVPVYECHVGEGITVLKNGSFSSAFLSYRDCKVYLPSTITTIEAGSFTMNSTLSEVHIDATTPPAYSDPDETGEDIFDGVFLLYVPTSAEQTYKTDSYWSVWESFININFQIEYWMHVDDSDVDPETGETSVDLMNDAFFYSGGEWSESIYNQYISTDIYIVDSSNALTSIDFSGEGHCSWSTIANVDIKVRIPLVNQTTIPDNLLKANSNASVTELHIGEGVTTTPTLPVDPTEVYLPSTITTLAVNPFGYTGDKEFYYLIINATTPPTIPVDLLDYISAIYVPDEAVQTYKTGYSDNASMIYPMSESGKRFLHASELGFYVDTDTYDYSYEMVVQRGDQFTVQSVLINEHNLPLTYDSDLTYVATVNANGVVTVTNDAEGGCTITISFAGNDKYYATEVHINLTIEVPGDEPEEEPEE